MGAYHTISSLICFSVIFTVSAAFDSSEVRLLEDQNGALKRQAAAYWSYFNDDDALGDASAVKRSQYAAATSPIIRFGKRSPQYTFGNSMTRHARTQTNMMDSPLIRFGKRSPSTAPLIRFGKRLPNDPGAPLIRFGKRAFQNSAPHIRFGKRSDSNNLLATDPLTSSEEQLLDSVDPEVAADYLYSRFNRNRRPNPVELEDTMLRFG
ncbi:FMRFamide-like neuropeptide 13 [Ditylenchus destructor]|uniref:FMRFamide-like neuropeptide 13 n=1 Tax=Ditylenchus destructor TaxID=166010 RepID=A0AAD4R1W3_9BILA|nr:FMRFamide-like neuropeptide 13 [Ditylenchus destructor]